MKISPLVLNPYLRPLEEREAPRKPLDLRPEMSEVGKGFRAFVDESQAIAGGLTGLAAQQGKALLGLEDGGVADRLTDYGMEVYKRNMEEATAGKQAPNIARVEDIRGPGAAFDWVGYQLGKGVPQLAGLGVGGLLGRQAAKVGAKKAISKQLEGQVKKGVPVEKLQNEAKELLGKRLSRGTMAGGFAAGYGYEGGAAFGQTVEEGIDPARAAASATAVGTLNGALEFMPLYSVAQKLGMGDFAKKSIREIIKNDPKLSQKAVALAAAKEAGRRAAGAGATGAVVEGFTEGMQELVNIAALRWAKEDPIFAKLDEEDWSQVLNATAAGTLVGGTVAGGVGPVVGPRGEQAASPATEPPTAEVPPTTESPVETPPVTDELDPNAGLADVPTDARIDLSERRTDGWIELQEDGTFSVRNPRTGEAVAERVPTASRAQVIAERAVAEQKDVEQALMDQAVVEQGQELEGQKDEQAVFTDEDAALQVPTADTAAPAASKDVEDLPQEVQTTLETAADLDAGAASTALSLWKQGVLPESDLVSALNGIIEADAEYNKGQPASETQKEIKELQLEVMKLDPVAALKSVLQEDENVEAPEAEIGTIAELGEVENLGDGFTLKYEPGAEFPWLIYDAQGNEIQGLKSKEFLAAEVAEQKKEAKKKSPLSANQEINDALAKGNAVNPEAAKDLYTAWLYDELDDGEFVSEIDKLTGQDTTQSFDLDLGPEEDIGVTESYKQKTTLAKTMYDEFITAAAKADDVPAITEAAEAYKKWQDGTLNTQGFIFAVSSLKSVLGQKDTQTTEPFGAKAQTGLTEDVGDGWTLRRIPGQDKPYTLFDPDGSAYVSEGTTEAIEALLPQAKSAWKDVKEITDLLNGKAPETKQPATPDAVKKKYDEVIDAIVAAELPLAILLNASNIYDAWVADVHSHEEALSKLDQVITDISSDTENPIEVLDLSDLDETLSAATAAFGDSEASQTPVSYQELITKLNATEGPNGSVSVPNGPYEVFTNITGNWYVQNEQGEDLGVFPTKVAALKTIDQFVNGPSAQTANDVTQAGTASTVPAGDWAPTEPPPGYKVDSSNISTIDGANIHLDSPLHGAKKFAREVAHIHYWITKRRDITSAERIELLKNLPKNSTQLDEFKAANPYLFTKRSVADAGTLSEAERILLDITHDHQRYTLTEVLAETELFQKTYGEAALEAALKGKPTQKLQKPQLHGWDLDNPQSEAELLTQDPHDGIWAAYPTQGPYKSRYGVLVINPKTGRVLLRRVANDYEGLVWDTARGGKDPNEHPLEAAKREAKEELGVETRVIGQLAHGFYSGRSGRTPSLYYVAVPVGGQGKFGNETSAVQWVDFNQAINLVSKTSNLPADASMKRKGPGDDGARKRAARITRTIEALYNPEMQKSGLNYRGSVEGAQKYYASGDAAADFPNVVNFTKKPWENLTTLQQMRVASALWARDVLAKYSPALRKSKAASEFNARKQRLYTWLKKHAGAEFTVTKIKKGTTSPYTFEKDKPIVVQLWHGSSSKEGLLGDTIDPSLFGSGLGGVDTKEGLYLTTTQKKAEKYGKPISVVVAFKKLKVEQWGSPENSKSWSQGIFSERIKAAKAEGYDGIVFPYTSDAPVSGHQYIVWNSEQVIAGPLESVGYTGATLYQAPGREGAVVSQEDARDTLTAAFSEKLITQLEANGRLKLEDEGPLGVAGEYDQETDTMTLYLDQVGGQENLVGALLHEGRHARLDTILGDAVKSYHEDLLKQGEDFDSLAGQAMQTTAQAGAERYGLDMESVSPDTVRRVREELSIIDPAFLVQEDLANYIQLGYAANTRLPLWLRLVNKLKTWWAGTAWGRRLKAAGIGPELSTDLAVQLARQAVRAAAWDQRNESQQKQRKQYAFAAHVTKKDFEKPTLKKTLTGEANLSYGYGFYLLEGVKTMKYYKDYYQYKFGTSIVQGYNIPNSAASRMLEWDRPLTQQQVFVQEALRSSAEGHLALRMLLAAKNRKTPYQSGPQLVTRGTGGAFYDALTYYYIKEMFGEGNGSGYTKDNVLNKNVKNKHLARRAASEFLNSLGIRGTHYLDAGSRVVDVRAELDGKFTLRLHSGTSSTKLMNGLSADELLKYTDLQIVEAAQNLEPGVQKSFAGYGLYNWVIWDQGVLDSLTKLYVEKEKVGDIPPIGGYDLNAVGLDTLKEPLDQYVLHPYTGVQQYQSKAGSPGGPVSRTVFLARARELFGDDTVQQALDKGILEVNNHSATNAPAGSFDPATGVMTVNLDKVSEGESPISILLHEGRHAGLDQVLGASLPGYHKDLLDLAERGNVDAQDSIIRSTAAAADVLGVEHELYDLSIPPTEIKAEVDRVRAEVEKQDKELLAQEDLAYYIQNAANNPDLTAPGLWRRILNSLRAWWAQTRVGQAFAEAGIRVELTPEMAFELGKAGVRAAAQREPGQQPVVSPQDLNSLATTWSGVKRWWATDANNPLEEFELGVGQKIWAHIGDNLATIDSKSKDVHKVAEVAKSKTSAEQSTINRLFLHPLVELASQTGLTLKQLDEWYTARSVLLDDENWQNLQKRSWQFARDLAKHIPDKMAKELDRRRKKLVKGEWENSEGKTTNVPEGAIPDRMIDLVEEYLDQMHVLDLQGEVPAKNAGWERVDLDWRKVKAHSGGMFSPGKVDAKGDLIEGQTPRININDVPDAQKIYKEHLDNAKLREMASLFDKMTKYQLDLLVEGQKITKEEAAAMREAHPHYVKTRRKSADNDQSFSFLKSRHAGGGKPKVRAGTVEYDPPIHVLQNTLEQAHKNAAAAQQNLAARYLYDQVVGDKEHWKGWFTTAPETVHRLDKLGFLHDRPTTHQDEHSIPVTIIPKDGKAGKTLYIKPLPQNLRAKLFAAGMNKLGAQQQGVIGKILGTANGIVRATAVSFSPAFLTANFFRDPSTAAMNLQASVGKDFTGRFINGRDGVKHLGLKNSYKVLYDVYVKGYEQASAENIKWVERWEKAGGRQSFTQALKEMDDGWQSFEKALFKAKTPGVRQAFQGLEFVEKINVLVENVSRFSAFNTVMDAYERGEIKEWKDKTKDEALREAAIISKELTTNFDRKGFTSSAIGLWHLFFNATVQGNAQVLINLSKSPKLRRLTAGTVAAGLVFDILGRALADDDDEGRNEWDNIPDYVKERNIILPIKIAGQYVKIPAPWVYNTVWRAGGLLGEAMAGVRDPVGVPVELAALAMNTFNPIASPTLAQSLSPTALDPLVMAVENRNFAGNPIRPTSFPGAARLPESQLYWSNTPESYVWLAEALNEMSGGDIAESGWLDVSPGVIQNTVNFFTAGVGKAIGQVYTMANMPWDEKEFNPRSVPILSTFAHKPGSQVDTQLYHDRVSRVLRAEKRIKLLTEGENRDLAKAREARQEYAKELRMVSYVKDVERQLKDLRERLREARGRGNEKQVERLKERTESVKKRFNTTYERRMS